MARTVNLKVEFSSLCPSAIGKKKADNMEADNYQTTISGHIFSALSLLEKVKS